MGFGAKFSGSSGVAVFVETATGVFGSYLEPNAYAVEVKTVDDTMAAVAVATAAGYGCSRWTSYYGAASGYPKGPLLRLNKPNGTISQANKPDYSTSASVGPKVTVADAGVHVGTPVMDGRRVIVSNSAYGVVAVRHVSAPQGFAFTGWRITRRPYIQSDPMELVEILSSGGTTAGNVTLVSAEELGGGALVIALPRLKPGGGQRDAFSLYDELVVEAEYVDHCTISFSANAPDSGFSGPPIPDVTVGFGLSATLPDPAYWVRSGYAFAEWNTAADGSGDGYAASGLFTPDGSRPTVALYAIWTRTGGPGAAFTIDWADDSVTGWPREHDKYMPYAIAISVAGVPAGEVSLSIEMGTTNGWSYYRKNLDTGVVVQDERHPQGGCAAQTVTVPTLINYPSDQCQSSGYDNRYGAASALAGYSVTYREWLFPEEGWEWTAPEIDGLEFEGWYTIDSGRTESVGEAVYSTLVATDRTVTWKTLASSLDFLGANYSYTNYLQVRYRGRRVTVTFQPNGGECGTFRIEVRHGEAYGELPVASRPGYTFAGWTTERDGGTPVEAETVVAATDDHALYAQWSSVAVTVTVCLVPCGGTVDMESIQAVSGSVYGELPVPVRDGYEFRGWFTASLGGSAVTADTVVGRTYTHWLYAQWNPVDMGDGNNPAGEMFSRLTITTS